MGEGLRGLLLVLQSSAQVINAFVVDQVLVSSTRITSTLTDFNYRVRVVNQGGALRGARATVRSLVATTEIRDAIRAQLGLDPLTPHVAAGLAGLARRYPVSRIEPRDDPFGIGLWSRLPASQVDLVSMPPLGFPALQLHWAAPAPGSLWLVHPFPPISGEATAWRDTQLRYTAGLIRGDEDAVLAGDLNTTPWSAAYRQLRQEAGLADSSARGWPWPTWFGPGLVSQVLAVPIDHVLHGSAWRSVAHRVGPDIGSDHRPLIVELARAH